MQSDLELASKNTSHSTLYFQTSKLLKNKDFENSLASDLVIVIVYFRTQIIL